MPPIFRLESISEPKKLKEAKMLEEGLVTSFKVNNQLTAAGRQLRHVKLQLELRRNMNKDQNHPVLSEVTPF